MLPLLSFYIYVIVVYTNGHLLPIQPQNSTKYKRQVPTLSAPMFANTPVPEFFRSIQHPFAPQYTPTMNDKNDGEALDYQRGKMVVPTNSWLSNLFYTSTNGMAPINTDPYTIFILDKFASGNVGVTVIQNEGKTLGGYPAMNNAPQTDAGFMLNPVVVSMRLTCKEWVPHLPPPTRRVLSWDHFGATIQLSSDGGVNGDQQRMMKVLLARGMAYITTHYQHLTPQFFTQHQIISVESDDQDRMEKDPSTIVYIGDKFKLRLDDALGTVFILYALDGPLSLIFSNPSTLVALETYTGTIRLAKLPNDMDESILDKCSGLWTTGGNVDTKANSYTIHWKVQGEGQLLLYAYSHHLQTLNNVERTSLHLESATKGTMHAVLGINWHLEESSTNSHLGNNSQQTTWFPQQSRPEPSTVNDILQQLAHDIETADIMKETTSKMDNYFAGKALQKYALLALLINKPDDTGLRNPELAKMALDKLKFAFAVFLENRQNDPFLYDQTYKGIVARNGLPPTMGGTGNMNSGFGHSYYNDHHYHQGYLIVCAAIIHYLDPNWRQAEIRAWTEILIRDVNSPGKDDYFAPFRNWDWFSGHTWAGGIKINGAMDGRDQESVPESVNFYWGMKLWGLATDNLSLIELADLQLNIMKRTTYEYFWMLDTNKNRPIGLVMNKVIGILFEQKVDYTTYFGRYIEYIHGIQQLPMTPMLGEVFRIPQFVQEEWDQRLASIAPSVKTAWAGVLYLNYALINPADAYPMLKRTEMDDGQSRSYSLYLAATRPGFHRRSLSKIVFGSSLDPQTQQDGAFKTFQSQYIDISHNQHDDRYNGY